MNKKMLKNIVSILKESPIYQILSRKEKRSLIQGLTEYHTFLSDTADEEIVGYESSMAGIMRTSGDETGP